MESLHPLVVHFPIALLLTAVCVDLAALVLKRPALHRVALWNLTLGTIGAGVAVLSGLRAGDVAKHSFEIWHVMELHKRLGFITLILGFGVTMGASRETRLPHSLRTGHCDPREPHPDGNADLGSPLRRSARLRVWRWWPLWTLNRFWIFFAFKFACKTLHYLWFKDVVVVELVPHSTFHVPRPIDASR